MLLLAPAGTLVLSCTTNANITTTILHRDSKIRLIEEVARSLEFAPELKHLANLVIDSLSSNGKSQFNALHLRVEKDAEVWADIMGGKDVRGAHWHRLLCWL